MKTIVLSGSARIPANTRYLARSISYLLDKKGVETLFFDIGERNIPIFTGNNDGDNNDLNLLKSYMKSSDNMIVCSPEYHNGMSGSLKNVLDHLSKAELFHKPVSIFVVAGGGKGGINALNQLRLTLRSLYTYILPEQLIIDANHINKYGELINSESKQQVENVIDELIQYTKTTQLSYNNSCGGCLYNKS